MYNLPNPNYMRRPPVLILVFCAFCVSCFAKTDSLQVKRVESLLKEIKNEYIPDNRVDVFNLFSDSLGAFVLETTNKQASEEFLRRYRSENIVVPLRVEPLPNKELGDQVYGIINVSVGNIRTAPRNSAEMATQALLGWQVDVLKKQRGYYLVRTPDGYISWLDAAAIALKNLQEIHEWNGQQRLIFTADYGHAYSEADIRSMRVSDLVMGNILRYEVGNVEGYYKVFFPDGREGFIEKELAQDYDDWKSHTHASAETILKIAKTMIGVPYLWGGTSVKGVDCSGFTKTAYFMNGVVIPRDASQQVLVGEPIDILTNNELDTVKAVANLKAGDLLFFAGGKHESPHARITHVALYMGNGQFIQSAGKVRINSMLASAPNYDDFQSRTLVAARRYLGHIGSDGIKEIN